MKQYLPFPPTTPSIVSQLWLRNSLYPKCCCFYCKSRARTVGGLAYIVSNLSTLQPGVVICRGHTWELQNAIKKSQNIHLIMFSVPFLVVPGCIQHTSRRVSIRGWACLAEPASLALPAASTTKMPSIDPITQIPTIDKLWWAALTFFILFQK